jgi:hypothetical protein
MIHVLYQKFEFGLSSKSIQVLIRPIHKNTDSQYRLATKIHDTIPIVLFVTLDRNSYSFIFRV